MSEEGFEKQLEERFTKLADELRDRERISNELRGLIEKRITEESLAIQRQASLEFKSSVEDHRKHIEAMYSKFERIVWLALILIGGIMAWLGFQSMIDLPKKVDSAINKISEDNKTKANDAWAQFQLNIAKQKDDFSRLVSEKTSQLNKTAQDSQQSIQPIADNATNALGTLVAQAQAIYKSTTNSLNESIVGASNRIEVLAEKRNQEYAEQLKQRNWDEDFNYLKEGLPPPRQIVSSD